eukprot:scaffold1306_cov100-Cylindrotheca_fusiformis.AAC.1
MSHMLSPLGSREATHLIDIRARQIGSRIHCGSLKTAEATGSWQQARRSACASTQFNCGGDWFSRVSTSHFIGRNNRYSN